jgi:hypothetical protein
MSEGKKVFCLEHLISALLVPTAGEYKHQINPVGSKIGLRFLGFSS